MYTQISISLLLRPLRTLTRVTSLKQVMYDFGQTPCALRLVASENLCFRVFKPQLKVINKNICYLYSV